MPASQAIVIQHGWDIYTTDGQHLGTAKAVSSSHVVVETGRIFKHDLHVPMSSFIEADETEHRGTLSVTSDQVASLGWEHPRGAADEHSTHQAPDADPPTALDGSDATDPSTLLRRHFTDNPGGVPIDNPEPAAPSLEIEPRAIDTPE